MSTPSQPMDEDQIHPLQRSSIKQQVIVPHKNYPCPRCTSGVLEAFGSTETLICDNCKRSFVPLQGGRLLFPATTLGWKIAPTFWWDGYHWHWGGTTASSKQLCAILLLSLIPALALYFGINAHGKWWSLHVPYWCHPIFCCSAIGLISMQFMYFFCWDFDFYTKKSK